MERKARQQRHRSYLTPRAQSEPIQNLGTYQGEYVRACHEAAAHRYQFRPYSGEVVLFLVQERSVIQNQQMVEEWQNLLDRPLKVVPVPGDHSTMMKEPQVRTLADRLTELLDQGMNSATVSLAGNAPGRSSEQPKSP